MCPEGTSVELFEQAGVPAETLDLRSFHLPALLKLSRCISRLRITLVHWNFSEPIGNLYIWGLSVLNPHVRHCYTDHISRPAVPLPPAAGLKKTAKRLLLRRYARVFCVSQFILDDLMRQQVFPQLELWIHFINTERFQPNPTIRNEVRSRFNVEGRFVLVAIAYLIPEKGLGVLIRSLAALPEKIVLWIVGEGSESEKLQQLCLELDLTSRTVFHGLQKDVAPFLQAADCFVCPSLWAEAAGLVNLEANACGIPVVASRIGGIPEYVKDGRTGLLFTPGDHRELAECVLKLSENNDAYRRMCEDARQHAVANFSTARVAGYVESYARLESENRSERTANEHVR
jgi:glycosyltransferase involved in cell wall biosynthesis